MPETRGYNPEEEKRHPLLVAKEARDQALIGLKRAKENNMPPDVINAWRNKVKETASHHARLYKAGEISEEEPEDTELPLVA